MQVTETNAEGLKREYKVRVEKDEIDQKVQDRLKEVGQQARIPGFRPGKAPMSILRQRFGKAVLGEVLERAVNDSSQQAVEERGLRPIQQPQIEVESFDENQDLEYKMSMEILPDIEPMEFSEISLERLKVQVPDSEVDEALERLSSHHKDTQPLEEARPAEKGDVLVVDFKGSVDGEELPGMSGEDHHLELGSNRFVEGFEEQLVGAEQGETRHIRVTFPGTYQNERLAGNDADFEVTVKEIRETQPVTIDDEFAKKFGEEDLEALKQRVREQIENDYAGLARQRVKRELLDKLSENHDFDVPPSMVEQEFQQIWHQIQHDRAQGQLDAEDADKDEEQLKEDYRDIAVRRVRLGLLLSEIGRRASIEISQEEMNQALIQEVQRHPGHEREVFEFYQNNPEALSQLRAPLYEDKAVDYILELANVTEREVTTDELRKMIEEEAGASGAGEEAEGAGEKKTAKKSGAKKASGKSSTKKSDGGSKAKAKTAKAESDEVSDKGAESDTGGES
jgi:trigger factor